MVLSVRYLEDLDNKSAVFLRNPNQFEVKPTYIILFQIHYNITTYISPGHFRYNNMCVESVYINIQVHIPKLWDVIQFGKLDFLCYLPLDPSRRVT
jgi:hypothetical protein